MTKWSYDSRGLLLRKTYPDGQGEEYRYDGEKQKDTPFIENLVVDGSTEAVASLGATAALNIEGEVELGNFEVTVTGNASIFAGGQAGLKFSASSSSVELEGKARLGSTYSGEVSASAEIGEWNPSTTLWDTGGERSLFGQIGQVEYTELWSHSF